jgi:hypothetical protein
VFYACFISYSRKAEELAERLYADLQNKGIRCCYAPEDLRVEDKFRGRIEESICLPRQALGRRSRSDSKGSAGKESRCSFPFGWTTR